MRYVLLLATLAVCWDPVWAADSPPVVAARDQIAQVRNTDELRKALNAVQELNARTLLPDVQRALERSNFATLPASVRGDAYAALGACGEESRPLLIRVAQTEREFGLLRKIGRLLYALGPEKSAAAIADTINRGGLSESRVVHLVLLWGELGKPGVAAILTYLKSHVITRDILEYCAIATARLSADKVEGAEALARALAFNTGTLVRTAQRDLFEAAPPVSAPARAGGQDGMDMLASSAPSSGSSYPETGYADPALPAALPAVDLVLLLDISTSMADDWEKAEQLVQRTVQSLNGKTASLRVGWIPVGAIDPAVMVHALSYSPANYGAVWSTRPASTSSGNTANCLSAVLEQCIFRPHARRIVVVIGDDGTVADKQAATAAAKRIREELSGRVFAILKPSAQHMDVALDLMCKAGGGELVHAVGKQEEKRTRFDFTPDWDAWLKPEKN